jgi:hypothetical protein
MFLVPLLPVPLLPLVPLAGAALGLLWLLLFRRVAARSACKGLYMLVFGVGFWVNGLGLGEQRRSRCGGAQAHLRARCRVFSLHAPKPISPRSSSKQSPHTIMMLLSCK